MRPGKLPVVRLDVEAGVDCALDHLLGLGHTRIAHVASSFDAPTSTCAASASGAQLGDDRPPRCAPFTFEGAAAAAGPLLDQGGFTAVFCDDDILAGGVYLAARDRGIRIPEDLTVVGFDDLDFARVLAPPLTTVARRRRASRRGGVRGAGARPGRRDGRRRAGHAGHAVRARVHRAAALADRD